ncbi:MAG TPA: BatB protein, partial [Flavobacterium sp.]|nr:BatB protein [Flavobacterium sp.]
LKNIAQATKGTYLNGNNTREVVDKLQTVLNAIEKNESETTQVAEFQTYYQWFLAFAFVLLVLDLLTFERKTAWIEKLGIFKDKKDE